MIRHKVIPPLKSINPSLEATFSKTLRQLKETEKLFLWSIEQLKAKIVQEEGNLIKINISQLKKAPAKSTVLFEIIAQYGFNSNHVEQIFRAIDNVGAQFYSQNYHILIERTFILIKRKKRLSKVWLTIEMLPENIDLPTKTFSATVLKSIPSELNQGKSVALIDLDKIKLPLTIRNWKDGDRFQPLGMNGNSKKVKDYLRDKKVSIFEKESVCSCGIGWPNCLVSGLSCRRTI